LKNAHLSSNSCGTQANIAMKFAEYVVQILLCKQCTTVPEIMVLRCSLTAVQA